MKILFISLGCDKNRVDAEFMLGKLHESGHEFTDDEEQAEAVIVNTCCFIDAAKEESIGEILGFAEAKKGGRLKKLIVTGCLAQRYRDEIIKEIPEVDAVLGIAAADSIAAVLADDSTRVIVNPPDDQVRSPGRRVITTGGGHEFLKIAEGCDRHCTYCVIPKIRGRYRSFPMEELVAEAQDLADRGITELMIVAQETTRYGIDLYGRKALPELLEKLCEIDGLHWIRLLYCYPEEIDDELIDVISREEKILNYLDIPIQSGSDRILKRMGRKVTSAEIRALIEKLRDRIPDICLRSTLITGFPGETAEDHRASMDLVRDLRLDRLGVFAYSQEEGTPAASLPDQVPERLKKTRRTRLMKLQQQIVLETSEKLTGSVMEAVIEGRVTDADPDADGDVYIARTRRDAPDVDGYVFIEGVDSEIELISGSFVETRITGAAGYDLTGVLL